MSECDKNKDRVILLGTANIELGQKILEQLKLDKNPLKVRRFADGEVFVKIDETIRGKDVYLLQSTQPPVNESLMELLLAISTCRRASAKRITAVIPYFGYARQDRKVESRTPISAADVAQLLVTMGVDRVVGVDIHCAQIQGFFPPRVPMDNLETHPLALEWFLSRSDVKLDDKIAVVSPDAGGVYRARKFQEGLIDKGKTNVQLALMIKNRPAPNQIGTMDLVGSVKDCDAIIIDDMVDTGGTLCEAAKKLKLEGGAKRVFAFISHGIFSGPCVQRITDSVLEQVIVTDSIKPVKLEEVSKCEKIKYISLDVLLSRAIVRITNKESVSGLF